MRCGHWSRPSTIDLKCHQKLLIKVKQSKRLIYVQILHWIVQFLFFSFCSMMLRQRNVFHLLHILAEELRMTRRRGERQAIIGFESSGLTRFILFLTCSIHPLDH
jgi:hypothetical protein